MIDPIIVVGMGRSGTSLVAGLLAVHGVWVGTKLHGPRDLNPRGDYQNKGVGPLIAKGVKEKSLGWFRRALISEIKEQEYNGGLWLIKHAPDKGMCNLWRKAFSPLWVCVRRECDAVRRSKNNMAQYKGKDKKLKKESFELKYKLKNKLMDELRDEHGIDVWPDKLVKGDYSEFITLCDWLGIEFSEEKTREFILPDKWRY